MKRSNIQKKVFFKGFRFCALLFFFFILVQGSGCFRVSVEKSPLIAKKVTCDPQADKAMERNEYETSIRLHRRLLEKEPENQLALYHLGYAYGHTGDHQKEVFYYNQAIALGLKEDSIFFNLGMAYGELDQLENAINAFNEGLELNPVSADNYFGLALTYQKNGRNQAAEMAFKQAVAIDPGYMDARFYLSLLYIDTGDFQEARRQLLKILEIDPSHMGARELLDRIGRE